MAPSGGQLWGEFGGCSDPCTLELVILVGFRFVIFVVQFESRDLKFCTARGLSNLGHEVESHENLFLGPFGDCTQITSYWLYNGIHYSVTGLGAPEVFLVIGPPVVVLLASRGP